MTQCAIVYILLNGLLMKIIIIDPDIFQPSTTIKICSSNNYKTLVKLIYEHWFLFIELFIYFQMLVFKL